MVENKLDDMQILGDALNSQKHITQNYNSSASECIDANIKSEFLYILVEEQQIESEIISEMSKRGWHKDSTANLSEIISTKEKYKNILDKM